MRVLAIEVSTRRGSVAVVGPEGLVCERSADVPGAHLEWLVDAIAALLRDAGMRARDVDALAVSLGPGGFVGLRIGAATASAWAHATGRAFVGVPTLDVIAAGVASGAEHGCPCLVLSVADARRGEVVAALFRRGKPSGDLVRLTPDLLSRPGALGALLPRIDERVVASGEGLRMHAGTILESLGPLASPAPEERWWPRASVLGAVGLARLQGGIRHDPMAVSLIYARGPEARAWEERSSSCEKGGA